MFRVLYLDMNSFFASVEQQIDPSIRGKPVAITAVDHDAGAVVAASYEAKRLGIGVGTRIYEAKRLCPGIHLRGSRHRLYARVNHRISEVIDEIAELEYVRSIDEFQVALGGQTARLDHALELSRAIKAAIRTKVGSELRCSIGIGPNQLLAKIAGKLEKPDGLQWLSPDNMPDRIAHLKLDDLPGISHGVKQRLFKAHVWDIPALYALDPRHARMIWHSVEGERFVRALQGENIPLIETKRHGYGNSKVLAPEFRPPDKAWLVGRWLLEKSASRLRRDGFCTGKLSFSAQFVKRGGWSGSLTTTATQDTRHLMSLYNQLWRQFRARRTLGLIISISVHLGKVIPLSQRSGELFLPLEAGRASRNEQLSDTIDKLNMRYGKRVIQYGRNQPHEGFFEKG